MSKQATKSPYDNGRKLRQTRYLESVYRVYEPEKPPELSGITATALCHPAWMSCCPKEDCYVIGLLPSIAIEQGYITRSSAHCGSCVW
jgi:hypothetical protein